MNLFKTYLCIVFSRGTLHPLRLFMFPAILILVSWMRLGHHGSRRRRRMWSSRAGRGRISPFAGVFVPVAGWWLSVGSICEMGWWRHVIRLPARRWCRAVRGHGCMSRIGLVHRLTGLRLRCLGSVWLFLLLRLLLRERVQWVD